MKIRQSLIGGDYGLINRHTLKPRPDYWLSWIWQQLMGTQVYKVNNTPSYLRGYCHQHPSGSGCTLMLINLSSKPCHVSRQDNLGVFISIEQIQSAYVLSAKKLTSKKVRVNQQKLRFKNNRLPKLDNFRASASDKLPPYSISFWHINTEPARIGEQSFKPNNEESLS